MQLRCSRTCCDTRTSVLLRSIGSRNVFGKNCDGVSLTVNACACEDLSPAMVACRREETRCDACVNNRWQSSHDCHRNVTTPIVARCGLAILCVTVGCGTGYLPRSPRSTASAKPAGGW